MLGGDWREGPGRAWVRAAGRFAPAAVAAGLLAALCLAVFASAPGPAAAQEPEAETLLRVDGDTQAYDEEARGDATRFSQKFVTGPNPAGYRLTSVAWAMRFFGNKDYGPIEARIYSVEDPGRRGREARCSTPWRARRKSATTRSAFVETQIWTRSSRRPRGRRCSRPPTTTSSSSPTPVRDPGTIALSNPNPVRRRSAARWVGASTTAGLCIAAIAPATDSPFR